VVAGARVADNRAGMDETPEELEQIRREAAQIDVNRYRKRNRAMLAIAVGALGAALVAVVIEAFDSARNPCERVRRYACARDPKGLECASYGSLVRESMDDPSRQMRGYIRSQCLTKIERMKDDDGVVVP
jgi:hypothetical protein